MGGFREQLGRSFRGALELLLLCGGYYVGGVIGLVLQVSPGGISGIWLPHAVLVAALMLLPVRRWWLCFAVLFPTHLHVVRSFQGPVPLLIMCIQFGGNIAQAALGAAALRWIVGRRPRLDDLRSMSAFILFPGFLAPAVVSMVVAALFLGTGWVNDFWFAWQRRVFTTMCAAIIAAPPIVVLASEGLAPLRLAPRRRVAEFGALSLCLTVVLFASFVGELRSDELWLLFLPLPLLLWSAVRFGPAGLGAHLFPLAIVALFHATAGGGPLAFGSRAEELVAVQRLLLVFAAPLMLLAALVKQHDRATAALRQSQAQYQSVVEDQTELICRFLAGGTYTFVNGAYARYFQRTPEELIGQSFFQFIPAESHEAAKAHLDSITPDHPVGSMEHSVMAPGGELRWHQWTDRGFFDDEGHIIEYQSVGRDITDLKRAEEQERLLEAQRQVEAALREGERKKDEFLAMLGHELRNPLAPIGTVPAILRGRAPHDDTILWAGEVIERQVRHLNRLVDDLLDISRITQGAIRLHVEPLDLGRVITEAVEASQSLLRSRDQVLSIDAPDEPLPIRGDDVRLTQIISNLLSNAVKYTDDGGRITLTARKDGSQVVLTVADNGKGIPAPMLENIFEMFAQVDGSRDEGGGGLGIGLTLVKQLVEMHGGTVEARSDGLGKGSEFVVRLPLASVELVERPLPTKNVERTPSERKRILIVDDNVDAALTVAEVLKLDHHEILVVHDGLAALSAFEQLMPDVVLLDIGLPELDGLEVARRLRNRDDQSSLLLVATTGFGQEDDRSRIADAGFDLQLIKPIDPDILRVVVSSPRRRLHRSE